MKIQAVFEDIKQKIANEIEKANTSIIIALAYFNDKELFNILCQKASQGLRIELIISSEDINYLNGVLDYATLNKFGGNCYFTNNNTKGLMHHKFCLIDDNTLITGSYNWTNKAASSNFENILIVNDSIETLNAYKIEFEKLKKISDNKLLFTSTFKQVNELIANSPRTIKPEKPISTGYSVFDRIIQGFEKSSLYVLAGRPFIGTSTLAFNIINNLIQTDKSVLLFSLDINKNKIINKLVSIVSEIPSENIIQENLSADEWNKLETSIKKIESKALFIDDTPDSTLKDIEWSIYKLKSIQEIDLIVIDYLELMKIDRKSDSFNKTQREYDLDYIVRELKRISKITDIPILLLSQLNRLTDNRMINNQYQSVEIPNYIEQYSDVITILNRPDKYGILDDNEGNSTIGLIDVFVSKSKLSPIGECKLSIDDRTLIITDFKPIKNSTFALKTNNFDTDIESFYNPLDSPF